MIPFVINQAGSVLYYITLSSAGNKLCTVHVKILKCALQEMLHRSEEYLMYVILKLHLSIQNVFDSKQIIYHFSPCNRKYIFQFC